MEHEFYAHSLPGKPREDWHQLEDHLKAVAEMARAFANDFGAGEWDYLAGLWHDLGKYAIRPQMAFTQSRRLTDRRTAKVEMSR